MNLYLYLACYALHKVRMYAMAFYASLCILYSQESQSKKAPPYGSAPVFQKSLAEFATAVAKKIGSFSAGACTWRKIHLWLRVCELCAFRRTRSALSRLQPFRRKAPKGIFDGLSGRPEPGRPLCYLVIPLLPGSTDSRRYDCQWFPIHPCSPDRWRNGSLPWAGCKARSGRDPPRHTGFDRVPPRQ